MSRRPDPRPTGAPRAPVESRRAERSVGVITNLKSRRNQVRSGTPRIVSPGVLEATPSSHAELDESLAVFARRRIDLLVIDGGDGTVRDVLTAAASAFSDGLPPLAIVPAGKTNALALDLGVPDDWTVAGALNAFGGRYAERSPVEVYRGDETAAHRGFLFGVGGFVRATDLAQRTHGWGAFNGVAVGLSLALTIGHTVFGGDSVWRRGDRMRIGLPDGVVHDRHFYLALVSTLERLPLGIAPFGRPRPGLKLLAVDAPPRKIPTSLWPLLRGSEAPMLAERGYHRADVAGFDLTIDSDFVLDGETYPGGDLRIAAGAPIRFLLP